MLTSQSHLSISKHGQTHVDIQTFHLHVIVKHLISKSQILMCHVWQWKDVFTYFWPCSVNRFAFQFKFVLLQMCLLFFHFQLVRRDFLELINNIFQLYFNLDYNNFVPYTLNTGQVNVYNLKSVQCVLKKVSFGDMGGKTSHFC